MKKERSRESSSKDSSPPLDDFVWWIRIRAMNNRLIEKKKREIEKLRIFREKKLYVPGRIGRLIRRARGEKDI